MTITENDSHSKEINHHQQQNKAKKKPVRDLEKTSEKYESHIRKSQLDKEKDKDENICYPP